MWLMRPRGRKASNRSRKRSQARSAPRSILPSRHRGGFTFAGWGWMCRSAAMWPSRVQRNHLILKAVSVLLKGGSMWLVRPGPLIVAGWSSSVRMIRRCSILPRHGRRAISRQSSVSKGRSRHRKSNCNPSRRWHRGKSPHASCSANHVATCRRCRRYRQPNCSPPCRGGVVAA